MSEKYLELIRQNIADVFQDSLMDNDSDIFVYLNFTDESKKKIYDYIDTNIEDAYRIESIVPFMSLLIHYLLFEVTEYHKFDEIDVNRDKEYVLVKYVLIPVYASYISEKIFGLKYPEEYTSVNIMNKQDVLNIIAQKISELDTDEIKTYIVENIYETFIAPIKKVLQELIFNLPEFELLQDYIDDVRYVFNDDEKIKMFKQYLKQNMDKLFYPDYEIPEKINKVYNSLEEVFMELKIDIKNRREQIYKQAEQYYIDVNIGDINNDFFRRYNLNIV